MNLNQAPIKTSKGLEEIAKRTHKLPAEFRQILIMVNGQATITELVKKLSKLGEIESVLAQLEMDGFIAPNPAFTLPETSRQPTLKTSQSPAASAQPLDFQPPRDAEFNLKKAKEFIRFILLGTMGPTAERRINRIEATTTPEALRVELDAIHDMLPKVLSKQEAQRAWRQLEPLMVSISTPPL